MSATLKAACIQNCATPNVAENIDKTVTLTRDAAGAGASFVSLPEYFSGLETEDGKVHPAAFPEAEHPVIPAFAQEAKSLGIWVLLGSIGVTAPDGRINNRGYLINPTGAIAARYDKIHMFDVNLGEGKTYRESATIAPGDRGVVAETPWGGTGPVDLL